MKLSQEQACNILEINAAFDLIKLKKQYRIMCSKHHPDRNPKGQEMMKLVNIAYDLLKKNPYYPKSNNQSESFTFKDTGNYYKKPHWSQDSNGDYNWNDEKKPTEPQQKTNTETKKSNHYKFIIYSGRNQSSICEFLWHWEASLSSNYKPIYFLWCDSIYPGSNRFIWGETQFHLFIDDEIFISDNNMSWGIKGQGFIG